MNTKKPRRKSRAGALRVARLPLVAAIHFAVASAAYAQGAAPPQSDQGTPGTSTLDLITVTSQKRTENLQDVPISIQVLGNDKLRELNVSDFEDYVKFLPSVSYQSYGPGFSQIYMRGVASGGDGNHSGSLPSVGVYLDEQPVTTIQGPLDIHIYDVARVEVLSGPQGTLYGASSQAGTIRIITNKPDPSGYESGYSLGLDSTSHGGIGNTEEAFVNIPISERAAIRLVGWHEKDAGYIDNVAGTRTYPSWDDFTGGNGTISNAAIAKDDYNDVDTKGARAALGIDLNDNWTINASLIGQKSRSNGTFAYDGAVGELELTHYYPEGSQDNWAQSALTVEGKIGNFDLTYAFAHLNRNDEVLSDYTDYSFWYDTLSAYGTYLYDNDDNLINPSQYIQGKDRYRKTSHELRLASPQEDRLRFVAGVFVQDQKHDIQQRYKIDGLADVLSVPGWPDTLWLTKQLRQDRDKAVFGELSYDFIPDVLTGTIGGRYFRSNNSLGGFFGFSEGFFPGADYGVAGCLTQTTYNGAPCLVFDKTVKENDSLGKVNLTWKVTPTKMLYFTRSEGYRPGGINRRGTLPPYLSDFLTNYEMGWKTTWLDNHLSFNGSVFRQDWKDFQFSILGANGLTEIKNANQARINGAEFELNWAATYNLQITGGAAFYNAKLTANYCGFTDDAGNPVTDCEDPEAPNGTRLPVTPKFKGNLTARYSFDIGSMQAYVQGSAVHVGERTSDLRIVERDILGNLPSYSLLDLSAGIARDSWSLDLFIDNVFDKRGQIYRFAECAETVCGASGVSDQYPNGQIYTLPTHPRMVGVRFSQKF
ncbi:TonB-dependent receptor [Dokdonella immobilis]|uniref:Outer membrane receptor proteins, mostly Fe transport n=1 Tax=Dokdonella immobilis TaxID=578942 RepID=A0A1I4X1Q8_9GAMM|nr:TonB-dependent receptor [Dokdonella immobilis]SFN19924.1 Outer membrane receptor proteins, mostly Fe transport [Dokdonella immobilis]